MPPVGYPALQYLQSGRVRILQEIIEKHPSRDERVRAWIAKTGKSERAFYRRLAEMS